MTPCGREYYLEGLVKKHGWSRGAELGVWRGRTYLHLLRTCPDLTLVGVDLYRPQPDNEGPQKWLPGEHGHAWDHESYYRYVMEKSKEYGARAILIRDWTHRAAEQVEDMSLDFVFIDADHSQEAVRRDILLWTPKVKDEGWIMGHDSDWPSVRTVVDELLPGWVCGDDNVWMRAKAP